MRVQAQILRHKNVEIVLAGLGLGFLAFATYYTRANDMQSAQVLPITGIDVERSEISSANAVGIAPENYSKAWVTLRQGPNWVTRSKPEES
jgi:hypothetical protein